MKRNLYLLFIGLFFLLSVYSQSEKFETEALNCWSKSAGSESETSGNTFKDGIRALDNYLMMAGYLKKGTPSDYLHFASNPKQIRILKNAPDFEIMKAAWNFYGTGAPDVQAFGHCVNKHIFAHLPEIDSSDVLFRLGKVLQGMEASGAPDNSLLEEFYRNLTKEELNRPFVKTLFYFVFMGTKNGVAKMKFE